MKTTCTLATAAGVLLLLNSAFGQGSAFNYQGRLNQNGNPINGTIAMKFSVWDSAMAGNLIAGPLTNLTVSVTQGLFAATLDFGASPFTGADRWLEIGVGTNASFVTLSPRQKLTPTPYSVMANSSSNLLGTLPSTQLSGNIADSRLSTNIARLNTNQIFTGVNTFSNVIVTGSHSLSFGSVNPSQGGTLPSTRSFLRLNPANPVTLSASTAISNGSAAGAILVLQGLNDINTVTIPDEANVQLGSLNRTLGNGDILTLIWDGVDWIELSYSNK